jgi:two-component system NtrC family sensor kinase
MPDTSRNPYKRLRGQIISILLCFGMGPLVLMGIAGFMAKGEVFKTWMHILLLHPALMWLLASGLVVIPLLSYFMTRHLLSQFSTLENERAALYESAAQSQKMATIGRLAGGIAHEINNPLAIIDAQVGVLSDLVKEKFPYSAAFKDRMDKIGAQIDRARKVTRRLLDFSQRVGPELEPVNVVAVLEESLAFAEKDIEASRICVIRDFSPDVPIIHSSLAQMQQVFLNLINNALDVIGEGGELRLSTGRSRSGVVIKVADTGPGIAEKDLPKIFEPFFSTKVGDARHTGLGLTICQEIVRSLEGRIEVHSASGRGTVFSVWFPLSVRAREHRSDA